MKIRRIYNESKGRYGSPRVYQALRREGVEVGENRVAKLIALPPFPAMLLMEAASRTERMLEGNGSDSLSIRNGDSTVTGISDLSGSIGRPNPNIEFK
ncbi:IS3 family transposase [Marinobacter sp. DUT-3]|uniref:IS3 family transposase n=1 Tax=Marinobacter sp. DUT-3 TaxID=3412036 RepID=UPI003D16D537